MTVYSLVSWSLVAVRTTWSYDVLVHAFQAQKNQNGCSMPAPVRFSFGAGMYAIQKTNTVSRKVEVNNRRVMPDSPLVPMWACGLGPYGWVFWKTSTRLELIISSNTRRIKPHTLHIPHGNSKMENHPWAFCANRMQHRRTKAFMILVPILVWSLSHVAPVLGQETQSSCLSNSALNAEFEMLNEGTIPRPDSCCMMDVCGLTCPEETSPPDSGT
jgi:hypothetical protein